MTSSHARGFTLLELLIVFAVIAVLAMMAVPNLVVSRLTTNETVAVAALRSIVTAQMQCQMRCVVDADGDGRGEALGLDELAGMRPLRAGGGRLQPTALPPSLGTLDANGDCIGRGYHIRLYLPDAAGVGVPATAANDGAIHSNAAETNWTCVAWPATRNVSGVGTYFTNQSGDILRTTEGAYSGAATPPPAGAALVGVAANTIVGGSLVANAVAADGNRWKLVR